MSGVLVPAHREHGIWGQKPRAPALAQAQLNCLFSGKSPGFFRP